MGGLWISGGKRERISKGLDSEISNQSLWITMEHAFVMESPCILELYREQGYMSMK